MIRREAGRAFLSAVFVDYDNIYLSLKRKNEEAAKRFARDAASWIKAIETGALITSTNGAFAAEPRRIVMNRCYGNPVPRRNQSDNSTDMNSFPFVRHHFLRAGFEIVDCPPLTAQLKNSSDIRMVMDVVDYLAHGTHFDEFVILSGDADFTPVLHRLRAHARRTVIFANDYTAAPYTAISDGEVRESDLISFLLEQQGEIAAAPPAPMIASQAKALVLPEVDREALRHEIIADVIQAVQASPTPVPLEVLADRAVRTIGHDRTVATSWAGAGNFRELLVQSLPDDLRLSDQPPYLVIDTRRHLQTKRAAPTPEMREMAPSRAIAPPAASPPVARGGLADHAPSQGALQRRAPQPTFDHHDDDFRPERALPPPAASAPDTRGAFAGMPRYTQSDAPMREPSPRSPTLSATTPPAQAPKPAQPMSTAAPSHGVSPSAAPARPKEGGSSIQQSIARIHEACQAPPLAPPEYRMLFEVMALEINENNLLGAQTIQNVQRRAQEHGLELRRDDVRFVMDVVSEADPWFEQGASANLFAGRFRNFVVARCRGQGLKLSADELDLIEAWFVGNGNAAAAAPSRAGAQASAPYTPPQSGMEPARGTMPGQSQARTADEFTNDEFPRIVRTRLRG